MIGKSLTPEQIKHKLKIADLAIARSCITREIKEALDLKASLEEQSLFLEDQLIAEVKNFLENDHG